MRKSSKLNDIILKCVFDLLSGNELIASRHTCHYFFTKTNELCSNKLLATFFPFITNYSWQRPDKLTLEYLQHLTEKYTLLRQVEFSCIKSNSHTDYWRFPAWVTHSLKGFDENGSFQPTNHTNKLDSIDHYLKTTGNELLFIEIRRVSDEHIDYCLTKYGAQYKLLVDPVSTDILISHAPLDS